MIFQLEIVAKLVEVGFTRICEITKGDQWPIYELPYHCVRQDLIPSGVVRGIFHHGSSRVSNVPLTEIS